jgi:hypothetical protein
MAEIKMEENWTYFQYHRDHRWPILIKFRIKDMNADLMRATSEMGFVQLVVDADVKNALKQVTENNLGRILTIREASTAVARQMESTLATDQFGPESLTTKDHYKVYRYKSNAFMVYSLSFKEWEMGVYSDFGKTHENAANKIAHRTVMFRFLSWALAPFGVIGFWSVPVAEGVVIMKAHEARGEAVFVDVAARLVYTLDGTKKISGKFQFIRLDQTIKGKQMALNQVEFASFLLACTTFLNTEGPTTPIRQLVNALSKSTVAVVLPRENFRPRQNADI